MYEKFKRLWNFIFKHNGVFEHEIIEKKYSELTKQIFYAQTLSDLMVAQEELKKFVHYVELLGNPSWARGKVQAATRYWHRKYVLWKLRG